MTDKNKSGDSGDVSYGDRGSDNMQDMTRRDAEAMDRAAQAGVGGAFDAAPDGDEEREEMRDDAKDAFQGGQR